MSHTVDQPIFLYLVSVVVVPCVHGIGVTTCYLSVCGARWTIKAGIVGVMRSKMICLHPLSHDLLSINRIYQVVACAMEGNSWHDTGGTPHSVICSLPLLHWIRSSLAYGSRGISGRSCRFILQPGLNADSCKDIWIGSAQDHSHRSTSRETCRINMVGINGPQRGSLFNSLYDSCNYGRFPAPPQLISRIKPVPTLLLIIRARLLWIDDDELFLICQLIHLCASGKVCRCLCAAV